jgi:phospholipase D1/2
VRALTHWQYRTISRERHSILHNLEAILGRKTHDYISFYGLRSHGRLYPDGPMATCQVNYHPIVTSFDFVFKFQFNIPTRDYLLILKLLNNV